MIDAASRGGSLKPQSFLNMAMRVIAGSAGGIPLKCPRHGNVRPTMDQVRAAIFSSLAERVEDATVLDLFAGTGGLGIEALSRGAKAATFVEKDRGTVDCIRHNLAKARLEAAANVVCTDVFGFCLRAARDGRRFDLIFADPPYQTKDHPADLASRLSGDVNLHGLLAADGIFVLEKSPRSTLTLPAATWQVIRQKRYGTAEVVFLQQNAQPSPDAADQTMKIEPVQA